MRFEPPLQEAVLLRRYKRFLADIRFPDGREAQAHCANPGSMMGVSAAGSKVYVSESDNPSRKLRYTLEAIKVGRRWVGIHPARANAVVGGALGRNRIPELSGFDSYRAEPPYPDEGRCDFLLEGRKRTWVEVKYVTLASEGHALFPDSVSVRATRHVRALEALARGGDRAVVLFVTPRADVHTISPADAIDPEFGEALRAAAGRVNIYGYRISVSRKRITWGESVPVDLTPAPAGSLRAGLQK